MIEKYKVEGGVLIGTVILLLLLKGFGFLSVHGWVEALLAGLFTFVAIFLGYAFGKSEGKK